MREIEKLLLDSANAKSISLPEKMESIYHKDLDLNKLKVQLKMLPDIVKVTPMDGIPINRLHVYIHYVKYLIFSRLSRYS